MSDPLFNSLEEMLNYIFTKPENIGKPTIAVGKNLISKAKSLFPSYNVDTHCQLFDNDWYINEEIIKSI